MKRDLYTADHEAFRDVAREFVEREVVPEQEEWNQAHLTGRNIWLAAGRQGVIGLSGPAEYGGAGQLRDFRYRQVLVEELNRVGSGSLAAGFAVQDDIVIPYVGSLGTRGQLERWMPKLTSGEFIGAIAITEPGAGSDLRSIKTTGTKVDGGWIVNGSKTFITNGAQADLAVTAVHTGTSEEGSRALSLLVIEAGMPGFERGRKLNKVGLVAQDTSELFFRDVFVPEANLLGKLGEGLHQLMHHLPLERLSIASQSIAAADAALAWTIEYVQNRVQFGKPIADFQNTRFELAEMSTEMDAARALFDKAVLAWGEDELSPADAAKVKWWSSDVQGRIIDRCVQLHGGYGFMLEYPIGRAFIDARIQRIYGGTNEIMKEIIGRDIVGRR